MKKILPKNIAECIIIWEIRKIALYIKSLTAALFRYKQISLLRDAVRYFPKWYKSIKRNNNPLDYDQPWIVYKAKQFLDSILHTDMTVWEYGSGSSTLYFARRVKQVYSVESDKLWFQHLQALIENQKTANVCYMLAEADEPVDSEPDSIYISQSSGDTNNKRFETYTKKIDDIPDNSLDLVLIDGRARRACIMHAKQKVKPGGQMVVDNSDRNNYFEGNEDLFNPDCWKSIHFTGPVPYSFDFSKTSFFQKR